MRTAAKAILSMISEIILPSRPSQASVSVGQNCGIDSLWMVR